SRRRHTRFSRDWSSDVCSSDLPPAALKDSRRGSNLRHYMKTEAPDSKPEIRGFVFMGSGLGIVQGSAFAPAQPKNAARRASPRKIGRASCRERGEGGERKVKGH